MADIGTKAQATIPASRASCRRVLVALLAPLVGVAFGAGGCSHAGGEARRLPSWVTVAGAPGSAAATPHQARPRGGIRGRSEASDFVVAALQGTGLRFGTDGSVAALWGYLVGSHIAVTPQATRPGDVLFFQTRAPVVAAVGQGCDAPDHVAIVSTVDPDGRIGFVEARDRQVRRSYLDPERPRLRRDGQGRILNSFLRPKRVDDPPETPAFAGEMLCAAVRPRT